MTHCTETQLDWYLQYPEQLTAEDKDRIENHLRECALCREHLESLQKFYSQLENRLQNEPSEKDFQLAERILKKPQPRSLPLPKEERKSLQPFIETYSRAITPYRPTLPERVIWFIRNHPVQSAGIASLAAAFLIIPLLLFKPLKNTNPAFAKIENYTLLVYNTDGELLWRKSALGLPNTTSEEMVLVVDLYERVVAVEDIDGDSKKEILLSKKVKAIRKMPESITDSLICFDNNGTLRWKAGVGESIVFGKTHSYPDITWEIYDFVTIKLPKETPRLFLLATAPLYAPSAICEVDVRTGQIRQRYWHPGHLIQMIKTDIDLDGADEIIAGGVNNAFNRAALVVLDPQNIAGYAPLNEDYQPQNENGPKAIEKYYLLFPMTNLGKRFSRSGYNMIVKMTPGAKNSFGVSINDAGLPKGYSTPYVVVILPGMRINNIVFGDGFIDLKDDLAAKGEIADFYLQAYAEELMNSVLYWDGQEFVDGRVINEKYRALYDIP